MNMPLKQLVMVMMVVIGQAGYAMQTDTPTTPSADVPAPLQPEPSPAFSYTKLPENPTVWVVSLLPRKGEPEGRNHNPNARARRQLNFGEGN